MIRAMLMDVGNVMVKLRTPQLFETVLAACTGLDEEALRRVLRDEEEGLHVAYEKGLAGFDDFYSDFAQRFGMRLSRGEFLAAWNNYFSPNRPMEAIVARLGDQVAWWGLSNTNVEHHAWVRRHFRVFDRFERIIGSHELGLRKPDPAIFERAISIVGLPAEQIFFVDDLERNVEAARAAGLRAFHYRFNDLELRQALTELGLRLSPLDGRSALAC